MPYLLKIRRKKISSMWLATFADLASLLITFFVLLFSMKEVDEKSWSNVSDVFADTFAQQTVEQPKLFGGEEAKISFLNASSLVYVQAVLEQRFKTNPVLSQVLFDYAPQKQTLTLSFPSALLFQKGEALLQSRAAKALAELAVLLQNIEHKITIVGHTDPLPLQQGHKYATNWELSMARALSVLKKLRRSGVVAPMQAVGLADSRFGMINSKLPQVSYEQARRVDIIINQEASKAEQL